VSPYQFPLYMAYELLLSKRAVSVSIRGVEYMRLVRFGPRTRSPVTY
jgi:hypothetical protein